MLLTLWIIYSLIRFQIYGAWSWSVYRNISIYTEEVINNFAKLSGILNFILKFKKYYNT